LIDIIEIFCTSEKKIPIFGHFRRRQATKMAISELSSISKKLKRIRTFEWYFRKQLTIEVMWAKYEEIRNFAIVISFSVLTETGS